MCAFAQEATPQFVVNKFYFLFRAEASRNYGLIRNNEYRQTFLVEQPYGICGTRQKPQLPDLAHQLNLLNDGAVAIEKNCPFTLG